MFGWLRRRNTDNWNDTGLQTATELEALAASNPVVADEVAEFHRDAVNQPPEAAAERSCRALSGYGIAVSKQAFLELLN